MARSPLRIQLWNTHLFLICLLSPESSGGQRSCSHTGLSAGWVDNTSSPGKELELNFPLTKSNRDLVLESQILFTEKSATGAFFSAGHDWDRLETQFNYKCFEDVSRIDLQNCVQSEAKGSLCKQSFAWGRGRVWGCGGVGVREMVWVLPGYLCSCPDLLLCLVSISPCSTFLRCGCEI